MPSSARRPKRPRDKSRSPPNDTRQAAAEAQLTSPTPRTDPAAPREGPAAHEDAVVPMTGASPSVVRRLEKLGAAHLRVKRQRWAKDKLYRILHRHGRTDVVSLERCRLSARDCAAVQSTLHSEFYAGSDAAVVAQGTGGIRLLRLQLGVPLADGLGHLVPAISANRHTLRQLDLSHNLLTGGDVAHLLDVMGIVGSTAADGALGSAKGPRSLEVLNVSYNAGIGDRGFVELLRRAKHSARSLCALIARHVGLSNAGAVAAAPILADYPRPSRPQMTQFHDGRDEGNGDDVEDDAGNGGGCVHCGEEGALFLCAVDHNRIGAAGLEALRRSLPPHVSLTASSQCPATVKGTTT